VVWTGARRHKSYFTLDCTAVASERHRNASERKEAGGEEKMCESV